MTVAKVGGGVPARTDWYTLGPSSVLAETIPRNGSRTVNVGILTSGTLHLTACYIPVNTTITNISYKSAGTAMNGPTHWWFALYDQNRLGLAITADQTNTAWAGSTTKTLALSATFTTTYSGLYYVGILQTATTAVGTLHGVDPSASSPIADTPVLHGNSTSGLTGIPTPGTAGGVGGTAGAITAGAASAYAWLT